MCFMVLIISRLMFFCLFFFFHIFWGDVVWSPFSCKSDKKILDCCLLLAKMEWQSDQSLYCLPIIKPSLDTSTESTMDWFRVKDK